VCIGTPRTNSQVAVSGPAATVALAPGGVGSNTPSSNSLAAICSWQQGLKNKLSNRDRTCPHDFMKVTARTDAHRRRRRKERKRRR